MKDEKEFMVDVLKKIIQEKKSYVAETIINDPEVFLSDSVMKKLKKFLKSIHEEIDNVTDISFSKEVFTIINEELKNNKEVVVKNTLLIKKYYTETILVKLFGMTSFAFMGVEPPVEGEVSYINNFLNAIIKKLGGPEQIHAEVLIEKLTA